MATLFKAFSLLGRLMQAFDEGRELKDSPAARVAQSAAWALKAPTTARIVERTTMVEQRADDVQDILLPDKRAAIEAWLAAVAAPLPQLPSPPPIHAPRLQPIEEARIRPTPAMRSSLLDVDGSACRVALAVTVEVAQENYLLVAQDADNRLSVMVDYVLVDERERLHEVIWDKLALRAKSDDKIVLSALASGLNGVASRSGLELLAAEWLSDLYLAGHRQQPPRLDKSLQVVTEQLWVHLGRHNALPPLESRDESRMRWVSYEPLRLQLQRFKPSAPFEGREPVRLRVEQDVFELRHSALAALRHIASHHQPLM